MPQEIVPPESPKAGDSSPPSEDAPGSTPPSRRSLDEPTPISAALYAPTPFPSPAQVPRPRSIPPPEPPTVTPDNLGARVLPNIVAGVISATSIISFGISLAALIFAGNLAIHLPAGIAIVLASSFIVGTIVALTSSFKPVVAAPQENTSVILALIASGIARNLKIDSAALLPTLVAAIGVTALATGVLFYVIGAFRLGKVVRFIPYPVVGGFLAGTGWLLVQGALGVMSDLTLTFDQVPMLFAPGMLVRWVPGVFFGLLLLVTLRRFKHYLVLPGLLLGGITVFYAIVAASGVGPAGAMDRHWLLGPFPTGAQWPPLGLSALQHIEWREVWLSKGSIAACTVLAGISILLNATGLELATEQDIDLDRELRVTGIANAVVGVLGGVPGYLLLSESTLNHKVGARTRIPGLVASGLCVLTLLIGTQFLAYFPKPVLGGLLLFLGVSFLVETVYDSWFRLPRGEYVLVILILFVVVFLGFLEGVGVGIVVSSFLFAVNYARIDVIKHAISGSGLRSKASRSPTDEALLQQMGGHVHVVQLQGYIFFGTSYQLLQSIRERLVKTEPLPAYFVVLDFRHVDGLDSSAVVSFARMRRLAEVSGAALVLTELPPSVRRQLERGGCIDTGDPHGTRTIRVFSDLDHGLEWCESQLLNASADSRPSTEVLARELEAVVRHGDLVHRLLAYLERVEAPAGFDIYKKGDVSNDLYLIESGELEAWLELAEGRTMRLRTMGPGNVVGESGLYLGARRSASVRTTKPSVLHRLSTQALDRMTREAPELAAVFHQYVARLLADRMVHTTSAAQMLFY